MIDARGRIPGARLLLVVEGQDIVDRIEAIRGAVSNDRNHLSVPFLVEGKYTYK